MNRFLATVIGITLALVTSAPSQTNKTSADPGLAEIQEFNRRFIAAHLKMDHALILSWWAEDGVDLMPGMAPIVGKRAITKFVDDAIASIPDYRVITEEIDFRDIHVSGDWASEWGLEHQVSQGPPGKPTFDGHGKILLIFHKDTHGDWKIQQEMWNSMEKE
jgi:ketosteroid isomerase-like protein